ncbi:hypothetical protein PAXRUDRAFT_827252 [Paxillus rubicundulus Ve08.2h10]|uniref:Uncharacterized protein n=1 Tax=Paxillus rubicundulus Ve08.2h10 TaxID=930991 RepID=A0A0D0DYA3_9AGAM|nr:hypothetical protein PAXRUDRAFT_827252 [Paxillus rubicundulus Ve08.2h10]
MWPLFYFRDRALVFGDHITDDRFVAHRQRLSGGSEKGADWELSREPSSGKEKWRKVGKGKA